MSATSTRIEGSGASMLRQAIQKAGYTEGLSIVLGTIKSPLPNIAIEADGIDFPLEKDDIVIAEHLVRSGIETGKRVFIAVNGSSFYVLGEAVAL